MLLVDSVRKDEGEMSLKHLHVACAIIERDGLVLAAQRSARMSLPLKWEFPGGKIDPGESAEDGLRRELMEEMGIRVAVGTSLPASAHTYPTFAVTLHPFICSIEGGEIILHEHAAIVWLSAEKLHALDWAAADLPVLESYLKACETVA
jgi:8-oxo-dGTP diphosphatase